MPQVEVRTSDDDILQRLAPDVLRGERMAARRVEWAITELAKRIEFENSQDTPVAPLPAAATAKEDGA